MNGANTTGSTALLPWIQEVCASERRLEAHLTDLKQLEEGSLHIVAFTSTLTQWLPQITKHFTEAHPHIDLRITCCDDQAQLEHIVESGQADVGFVALPVKRPLEMELLVRDPLLVAVAPDSPSLRASASARRRLRANRTSSLIRVSIPRWTACST